MNSGVEERALPLLFYVTALFSYHSRYSISRLLQFDSISVTHPTAFNIPSLAVDLPPSREAGL